jgi:hypothetical protein
MVWFQKKGTRREEGFLTYVETSFSPSSKLKGNIRLQYFETGSYDSRIYAYESDVLYSFSIPALFGKGYRTYLNLQYNARKHVSFWVRLAQTVYRGRDRIGSGLDEINGTRKTDVKAQIQYRF